MKKYYIIKELRSNKYIKSSFNCNWDELEYTDEAKDALFYKGCEFMETYFIEMSIKEFIAKIPDTHQLIFEIITVYTN